MTVGQEPGDSTMIRISIGTKEALNTLKNDKSEAIGDVVKRLVRENQTFKKIYPSTQTRPRMEKDMKGYVLNPAVPSTSNNHREIYLKAHPGEVLHNTDIIHHVNGNHDDNRPENLLKTTDKDHRKFHAELDKENALFEQSMP